MSSAVPCRQLFSAPESPPESLCLAAEQLWQLERVEQSKQLVQSEYSYRYFSPSHPRPIRQRLADILFKYTFGYCLRLAGGIIAFMRRYSTICP
jgi:hypothetical protein